MKLSKKILLAILDGWGVGTNNYSNAIYNANIPFFNYLLRSYPNNKLYASEEYVGLPKGQMGNSEVGHMALGSGRIIYQNIVRIDNDIKNNSLKNNVILKKSLLSAKANNKAVHIMGLVSDGGIHSHIDHLKALLKIASEYGLNKVYVHAFSDGRDTDPHSAINYITDLQNYMHKTCGKIASISGRYYAMDRDSRWDRTMVAFNTIFNEQNVTSLPATNYILQSYKENISDEFIKPTLFLDDDKTYTINDSDTIICFNFRTDRCRQISSKILELKPSINYITMTDYDKNFKDVKILYETQDLNMTLGEVVSKHSLKQLRIAETEKYPHVTFFFSGGQEEAFANEKRILIPSPKVSTYDLAPQMSALEITNNLINELNKQIHDFVCLNFANTDMVGHTGVFDATIKAAETIDTCLERVVKTAVKNNYSIIVLSDHGNADYMINSNNTPNTAHTLNMVPVILIDQDYNKIKEGKLADIAPSILKIFGLDIPKEMTGNILI